MAQDEAVRTVNATGQEFDSTQGNEILNILISSLRCRDKAQR